MAPAEIVALADHLYVISRMEYQLAQSERGARWQRLRPGREAQLIQRRAEVAKLLPRVDVSQVLSLLNNLPLVLQAVGGLPEPPQGSPKPQKRPTIAAGVEDRCAGSPAGARRHVMPRYD